MTKNLYVTIIKNVQLNTSILYTKKYTWNGLLFPSPLRPLTCYIYLWLYRHQNYFYYTHTHTQNQKKNPTPPEKPNNSKTNSGWLLGIPLRLMAHQVDVLPPGLPKSSLSLFSFKLHKYTLICLKSLSIRDKI